MADTSKDTIYIDIDDEITAIIEKVGASDHKILALVLPKRAAVLQSIVNMKLLKRTAKEDGKKIVLITSEHSLLPLAGAVGIHVARTLQSKPAIPPPPEIPEAETVVGDSDGPIDKSKSVGELAGLDDEKPAKVDPPEETIDVDNSDDDPPVKSKGKKKGNKIKIPNFDKFRLRLILGGAGLVLLIIFWIFAFKVWPKATVTIKTNAVAVDAELAFTANTEADKLDEDNNIVPAVSKDTEQTDSLKVAATGEKNIGEKASGSMKITNCSSSTVSLPAGTGFSSSGLTFVSDKAVSVPKSGYSFTPGGFVCDNDGTATVKVTAQSGGTKYNVSARSYTISSSPNNVSANGSDMSGGTDKTVTVVSQKDVDDAKKKITDNTDAAKEDLTKQFNDDSLFALGATILPGKQTVSPSVKVGDEATEVNVTVQTTYTMLGVKRDDLKKLVENEVKKKIDTTKQALSDDGLDEASFEIKSKKSASNLSLLVQTTATAGAQFDEEGLKTQITGKKRGDIEAIVTQLPSVESVSVDFSPFWVNKTPSNPGKITVVVEKQQAPAGNDAPTN